MLKLPPTVKLSSLQDVAAVKQRTMSCLAVDVGKVMDE